MNDIMERLAAARPSRLDPSADPDRRYRDLETAMAQPPERPGRHLTARRTARRAVRRRMTAGLGLIAVGAAAAIAIDTVVGTAPTRTGHGTPPKPALGGIQLAAAKAETLPTGKFWFSDAVEAQSYIVKAKTGDYALSGTGSEYFGWTAAKAGGGERSYDRDLPFRPVSAADKAAWRRAGSPATVKVPADDHYDILRSTTGRWNAGNVAPHGGGHFGLGLTAEQIEKLPTDPDRLAKRLFQPSRTDPIFGKKLLGLRIGAGAGRGPKAAAMFKLQVVRAMLEGGPVTPKLQAALMRALKAQPGIQEIGRVTDPFGRKGVALAADFLWTQPYTAQDQLVFDLKTGKYLGEQEVLTRPGGDYASRAPGFLIFYWVVRDSGWTDTKPKRPTSLPF